MDGYTHRFSLITEEIQNKVTILDDTLNHSKDTEENFVDVCQLLSVGHEAGLIARYRCISLNPFFSKL